MKLNRSAAAIAAGAAVTLILTRVAPHEIPLGTVLFGVLYGSVNGLLALGLVLMFRVTRAINFAYGAMGGFPAGIAASIYVAHHWPWGATFVVALVVGALTGLAVGALVNWRFANSPRLVLTVATIGLAQLLGGMALFVPRYLKGPALIASFPTGLSKAHFFINPVLFDGNDLVIVVVVPLVVIAVSWFLLGTDAGRAVRAIADNPDRARLLGIPARRLLLAVWTISGALAALAVMLQAPSSGVPLDAAAGPSILLAPLAAAVVARFESLVTAFASAVALGVLEYLVRLNVNKQSIETPVFLGVIIVALLLQRRTEGREALGDESSWSAGGTVRPVPAILRRLPEVRLARLAGPGMLIAIALSLPAFLSAARLDEASVGIVFAMAALSLVVLSGWAGTVSLGQMALVGVGSIAAGDLMMHANLDLFLSLAAAGVAGALAAVVLGLPALRVRGLYVAVTTLAFAVAANDFFYNPTNFGAQLPSSVIRPVLWKRFDLLGEGDLYLLCLALLVLTIVLAQGLRAARPGRAILATRDNLRAAEAASVGTTRTRLMAFMIAGVIAGVAGGLYVVILGSVGYQTFQPVDSITVFSMVVIGGMSSISGSLAGVILIQWLGIEAPDLQIVLTGVGLMVVLMAFPSGLAGLFETLRDRGLALVARRRGLELSAWVDAAEQVPTQSPDPVVVISPELQGDDALLSCKAVSASYGPMQVLFGVDLTVKEGEIVALLGTNGAGKSSLLRSVTGLLPASGGQVSFRSHDITHKATEEIATSGLTMMPGGRGVFPSLPVAENLRVASWPLRRDRVGLEEAKARTIGLFPILDERSSQLAGNLSGGEQQMLSLAMAFLVRPKLLCIDELSLGLAPTVVAKLLDAVRDIHRQGTTVVIVEQSVNVALLVAERATFLEKGRVRFTGPAAGLLDRPDLLRAVFIGGENGKTRSKRPARTASTAPASTARASKPPAGRPSSTAPALDCRGLVKRFGGITAVDHVDLAVDRGEVVGLIGHNGAGKTTLFDVACGFLPPEEGLVAVDGNDVTALPPHQRARWGLGRSFQEARLFPSLTVAETIAVALDRHAASREPFAAAFRMPASTDSEAALAERVDEIVEQLGLSAYRHRRTGELSTGTRRVVELACVMAQRPSLLLLDEPSAGVAQAETEALGPLLRQVAGETGCAMVVIEHDMAMLTGLCDRLVALELGAVIASGEPDEVLSHPRVIASYLGTDETHPTRPRSRTRRRGANLPR